jgi:hypothetical protein
LKSGGGRRFLKAQLRNYLAENDRVTKQRERGEFYAGVKSLLD